MHPHPFKLIPDSKANVNTNARTNQDNSQHEKWTKMIQDSIELQQNQVNNHCNKMSEQIKTDNISFLNSKLQNIKNEIIQESNSLIEQKIKEIMEGLIDVKLANIKNQTKNEINNEHITSINKKLQQLDKTNKMYIKNELDGIKNYFVGEISYKMKNQFENNMKNEVKKQIDNFINTKQFNSNQNTLYDQTQPMQKTQQPTQSGALNIYNKQSIKKDKPNITITDDAFLFYVQKNNNNNKQINDDNNE